MAPISKSLDNGVKTADTSGDIDNQSLGLNALYARTPEAQLPTIERTTQPVAASWPSLPPVQDVEQSD